MRRKIRKGAVNRVIDAVFHPFFDDPLAVVLDGVAHLLNEGDLEESLLKFARYNLPFLLRWLEREVFGGGESGRSGRSGKG